MVDEQPNDETNTQQQYVEDLMLRGDVPKIYVNSFVCGLGRADVVLLLKNNNAPMAVVNLSHQTTKALARSLQNLVTQIEAEMGHELVVNDDEAQ